MAVLLMLFIALCLSNMACVPIHHMLLTTQNACDLTSAEIKNDLPKVWFHFFICLFVDKLHWVLEAPETSFFNTLSSPSEAQMSRKN